MLEGFCAQWYLPCPRATSTADATADAASRATGAPGAAAARCTPKYWERETVTAIDFERVLWHSL